MKSELYIVFSVILLSIGFSFSVHQLALVEQKKEVERLEQIVEFQQTAIESLKRDNQTLSRLVKECEVKQQTIVNNIVTGKW